MIITALNRRYLGLASSWELLGDYAQVDTSTLTKVKLVGISCEIHHLMGANLIATFLINLSGDVEEQCSKDFYALVVGRVHAHGDFHQIISI